MHSFWYQLQSWHDSIVKHYIFETVPLHFRIAIYFHSNSYPNFTTLPHLFHHLYRLHLLLPLVLNQELTVLLVSFPVINHVITVLALMF